MPESLVDFDRRRVSNLSLATVSITLLFYDYCLTLPLEVSRFWKHGEINWAIFFFYLNRYLALLEVRLFIFCFNVNFARCAKLQLFHQTFSILSQLIIAIMLVIRTYALYERSRRILFLLLVVTVAIVAAGLWAFISVKHDDSESSMFCPPPISKENAIRFGSAWTGMLIFDTMIFVLTIHRALVLRPSSRTSILHLLLRDGGIYYVANLFNCLTFLRGDYNLRGIGTTFTNAISSIMMSRLTLNLRNPAYTRSKHPTSQTMSTVLDPQSEWTEFSNPFLHGDSGDMELDAVVTTDQRSRSRKA